MTPLFAANGHLNKLRFQAPCWQALQAARDTARQGGWDNLRTPHIFVGLLLKPDSVIANWSEYAGLNPEKLGTEMRNLFQDEALPRPDAPPLHREFLSNGVIQLLQGAEARAQDHGRDTITSADIAVQVLSDPESVVHQCLIQAGLSCMDLATLLETAEQAESAGQHLA